MAEPTLQADPERRPTPPKGAPTRKRRWLRWSLGGAFVLLVALAVSWVALVNRAPKAGRSFKVEPAQFGDLDEVLLDEHDRVLARSDQAVAGQDARQHAADARGYIGPNLRVMWDQFGADLEDPSSDSYREAREAVRSILYRGVYVPTGAIMPAWDQDLTDEAIEDVLDYLETIQIPLDEAGVTAEIGQQGLVAGGAFEDDGAAPVDGDADQMTDGEG